MFGTFGACFIVFLALNAVEITSSESDTFLWGVATAAYQTEGSLNFIPDS
jgi:hypothetical protein